MVSERKTVAPIMFYKLLLHKIVLYELLCVYSVCTQLGKYNFFFHKIYITQRICLVKPVAITPLVCGCTTEKRRGWVMGEWIYVSCSYRPVNMLCCNNKILMENNHEYFVQKINWMHIWAYIVWFIIAFLVKYNNTKKILLFFVFVIN